MAITFSCPKCRKSYRTDDWAGGKVASCRGCGQRITIPAVNITPAFIEKSESGAHTYRHQTPTVTPPMAPQPTPFFSQISKHIESTIGPIGRVFPELISNGVRLDLILVPPTNLAPSPTHPFGTSHYTIITSGMSSKPMNVPADHLGPRFIELMIALPAHWRGISPDYTFDQKIMKKERYWWPFRWLKKIGRMPAEMNSFLDIGQILPSGERAAPFASNTRLNCMLVSPPLLSPESVKLVINEDVSVYFLALMPIYPDEAHLKTDKGIKALNDRLDAKNFSELIWVARENVGLDDFGPCDISGPDAGHEFTPDQHAASGVSATRQCSEHFSSSDIP